MADLVIVEEQGATVIVQEVAPAQILEVTGLGPQGPAGTIAVGSVTTGAAGSSVQVVNAGTSSEAVLNFTIPRGDTGDVTPEATAAKVAAEAAAASAAASQTSATASATSATNSATSATASATAAATSATAAATSATAAAASATSAATSATLAQGTLQYLLGNDENTLTPAAGTTTLTASYLAGYEDVYRNGVKLVRGSDYTATNGTSVTLTAASIAGDVFQVITKGGFKGDKGDTGDVTPELIAAKTAAESAAAAAAASQTAAASSASAASGSASAAAFSATAADASADFAETSASTASVKAAEASVSAASALTQANNAATQATEANFQASVAVNQANIATTQAGIATTKASEAAASATTATTKAGEASASAATATAQATIATTKATEASASASSASGSATSATASATTATTQAGIATTKAGEALTSATNAATSAAAALTSQNAAATSATNAAGSATTANTKAGEASGSAASALAIYGTATAQQTALANAQAAASLAQGYAASASSVVQQDLTAVAAALHRSPNAITSMFVYDTSKDSDGGAWTEKCQHTSWYNEDINGKWLGAWVNETEARNAGSTVGAERITAADPEFGSSTGWTLGTNISIADGKLIFSAVPNAQSAVVTVAAAVVGVTYRLQIKIDALTSGTLRVAHGGVTRDFAAASGSTQTIYLVATNGSTSFTVQAIGTTTATIDLVSAREVTAQTTQTGDYFQLTTDGKFYKLNAGSGTTEVFRGNKRDFPRLAAIVAEAANVTIYDLTEPGRPMWMRFVNTGSNASVLSVLSGGGSVNPSAVSSLNAVVSVGSNGGLALFDFSKDTSIGGRNSLAALYLPRDQRISARNSQTGVGIVGGGGYIIANNVVNAVAMTVLSDAPVDPVTGLRVPTIAVATGGGVSLIQNNGVVLSGSAPGALNTTSIDITEDLLTCSSPNTAHWYYINKPGKLVSGFTFNFLLWGNSFPWFNTGSAANARRWKNVAAKFDASRVGLLRHNAGTVGRGVGAVVANTFNTGHMVGDIRRAFLADADVGSVSGTELVTNGTFDTDTTGWISMQNATVSWNAGRGRATGDGVTGYPGIQRAITTVVGKRYRAEGEVYAISGGTTTILQASTSTGAGAGQGEVQNTATYKAFYFTATATTTYIKAVGIASNAVIECDNISVKEVAEDRSYKAQGATITGTLAKTAVASAAQLVAYSGFSASNYLREPYSADLDFGTAEWSASAWVNVPVSLSYTGLPLGPELVTNGDFSSGAAGWTFNNFAGAPNELYEVVGGRLRVFVNNSTGSTVSQTILTAGKTYKFTATIEVVSGRVDVLFGSSDAAIYTTPVGAGTYSVEINGISSTGGSLRINNNANTNAEYYIDNVSVKEVAPMRLFERAHSSGPILSLCVNAAGRLEATAYDGTTTRTVTTSATYNTATWLKARANYTTDGTLAIMVNGVEVAATRGTPLLSLNSKYNQLTYTQSFDNAAWIKDGASLIAGSTDPLGGTTAFKLTATGGNRRIYQSVNQTSGQPHIFSIYMRRVTGTGTISMWNAVQGVVDVTSQVTSSWSRVTVPAVNSGGSSASIVILGTTGDEVEIWGAQAEAGSTAKTYQRVGAATDFDFQAPLTIGNSYAADAPFPGLLALVKFSATVPTPEQAVWMYEQEKQMFRSGAQVCLPDSGSIVDLTYDDATDKWIAVSATNESEWSGLVRTSVTPTPAGSYIKASAASGVQLLARSTTNPGVDITIPAYGLREELVKRAESAARLNAQLATFDYVGGFTANTTSGSTSITSVAGLTYPTSYIGARISGTGIPANTTIVAVSGTTMYLSAAATATATAVAISFVDFMLPVGLEAKEVSLAGAAQREGSTAQFTRLFDGFRETIRFGTAPSNTALIQIQATRSAA